MSDEAEPETPADGAAEPADAGRDLEALQAENAQLREQVLRYAADAENTRRRAEREANDARAYAITKFARDLLGVADNLARAMQHAPRESADAAVTNFVAGLEMTERELVQAFERNGLKPVDPPKGAAFDPHKHQAMIEQPAADVPPGGVVQVMQTGYELFGRIVRPALVAVAPKGEAAPAGPRDAGSGAGGYARADGAEGADAGGSVDTRA